MATPDKVFDDQFQFCNFSVFSTHLQVDVVTDKSIPGIAFV